MQSQVRLAIHQQQTLLFGNKRKETMAFSLVVDHDSLHHALQHLVVELERLVSGELDVFGQVVGQQVDELAVTAFIEERLVCELCLFVTRARRCLGRR